MSDPQRSGAGTSGTDDIRAEVSQRWQEIGEDELTPRQAEQRRLAASLRHVIERLVATTAPEESIRYAADALDRLGAEFDEYPSGRTYEGFAEAANAGADSRSLFDHSPFIGRANPLAPPIHITVEEDQVVGEVVFGSAYEGPPGCVHGGYIAAAFDEVLGGAQSLTGRPGMTGTLTVRYRTPTPLHTPLRFVGWPTGVERRKIFVSGECHAGDTVTAEAEGIFISVAPERMAELKALRDGS